jgi:hypothetical protein
LERELTERSSQAPDQRKPALKKQASVALTQEGERNQVLAADASRQRVDELRAQFRKQKRSKKAP